MKTISTKLDNSDFKRFQDMCNHDGMCASEALRDMIKRDLEAHEEYLESSKNEKKSLEKPRPITQGKILDDEGNVIGTF